MILGTPSIFDRLYPTTGPVPWAKKVQYVKDKFPPRWTFYFKWPAGSNDGTAEGVLWAMEATRADTPTLAAAWKKVRVRLVEDLTSCGFTNIDELIGTPPPVAYQ